MRSAADRAVRGGDLFDVFYRANGSAVILIADASSKGDLGILHTRTLRRVFRARAAGELSPAAMLSALNTINLGGPPPLPRCTFASALIVAIESGGSGFRYASAGHDVGLVVRGDAHRHLVPTGPVLGIVERPAFAEVAEPFGSRDLLILATDGFTECRSASEGRRQFGTAGIARALASARPPECVTAARNVARSADAFTRGCYRDDATVAVVALNER